MLPFKHRNLSLQEKEIRLLRLDKTEDEAAPIRLSIRHATLDETLEFNALSYAWGYKLPSHNIVVCDEDGQEGSFDIRENLHDFFVAARKFHEPWTTEWIWIDQICISQNHHEERCHQVAQMATLYATAKATIVWPGVMPAITEETPQLSSLIDLLRYEHATHDDPNEKFDIDLMDKTMRCGFSTLLLQPYWSRLWIVQKIALASLVVVFLTHTTCSLDLLTTILYVARDLLEDNYINLHNFYLFEDKVTDLQVIRGSILDSSAISWFEVLRFSCQSNFSESLDRVYALMGLVHESRRFQPDYNLSARDLLMKILQAEIASNKLNGYKTQASELLLIVDQVGKDQSGPENMGQHWSQKTENRRFAIDILTELGADIGNEIEGLWGSESTQSFGSGDQ